MKPRSFLHGAGIALALSLVGSILYTVLTPLLSGSTVLRMLIALLGLSYVIYILACSGAKTGRVTALLVWITVATASWFAAPPLVIYLLIHAALIWLLRSLYRYSSAFSALLDFGLSALSVAAAIWALFWSGSLLLAIWCFFLVQALSVSIPRSIQRRRANRQLKPDHDENFQRAYRAADKAIMSVALEVPKKTASKDVRKDFKTLVKKLKF